MACACGGCRGAHGWVGEAQGKHASTTTASPSWLRSLRLLATAFMGLFATAVLALLATAHIHIGLHLHRAPCTRTVHPAPYTVHPAPCILHPTPCTLHPAPYTLHPSPCTLHRTPCTLHRTPFTLQCTPYTLVPYLPSLVCACPDSYSAFTELTLCP